MDLANPPFLVDRADGVVTLSFNRPEAGNAIPPEAVADLIELFTSIRTDASVRALLVRGEGRNFSSGGDVRNFARSLDQTAAQRRSDFARRLDVVKGLVEAYLAIEVPIVVACQGAVAGAALLYPLGADVVLADASVTFLFSHQRIGLTPDAGVSLLLPRVVGARRAAELVLTAANVDADEAWRIGIVSKLVGADALQAEARRQAARLARGPARTIRMAKHLIAASTTNSVTAQLQAERDAIVAAVGEPDFAEGVRAFLEKRPARFAAHP
jgi:2-(1,2-epoxy-1,2-dihydrophenyl)acetyl-CoA isomerase